jgi:hypothetical protein
MILEEKRARVKVEALVRTHHFGTTSKCHYLDEIAKELDGSGVNLTGR